MPELILPQSDTQRLQALRRAKIGAEQVSASDQVLLNATQVALNSIYERWEREVRERNLAQGEQNEAQRAGGAAAERLRLYLSHFLQVFNMAVLRGECSPSERALFQLPVSQDTLPSLANDSDLATWGERVVNGEKAVLNANIAP